MRSLNHHCSVYRRCHSDGIRSLRYYNREEQSLLELSSVSAARWSHEGHSCNCASKADLKICIVCDRSSRHANSVVYSRRERSLQQYLNILNHKYTILAIF